jgi:hypothetical protein
MSNAPERIWADGNAEWDSGSWGLDKEFDNDVEYIRAGPHREYEKLLTERIRELERILSLSPCEIAAHSNRLTEYMFHWEGRAEAAEAKLAKALRALERIELSTNTREQGAIAMATLAELKGETDE